MSFGGIHPGPHPVIGRVVAGYCWPTRIDHKEDIVNELLSVITERGWMASQEGYWLQLCLEEVVINAMLHGNEGDPTLLVSADVLDLDDSWAIALHDSGAGFQATDLPDHEDPASLLLEHGRGILLMREWLDQLAYYRGGATAWLQRRKDSTEGSRT
jgi:serine/threonine-protein kinase RsbW